MRLRKKQQTFGAIVASRSQLYTTGGVRILLGVSMITAPERSGRSMGLDAGTAARSAFVVRMTGVRDAALGAGLIHAVRRGSDPVPWLVVAAASDAVDALAFTSAWRRKRLGARHAVLGALMAGSGVAVEVAAARELTRR